MGRKSSKPKIDEVVQTQVTEPALDFNKIVETSKASIQNEKPKRHRRTKAEIEAARGSSPQNLQSIPQPQAPQVDRAKELKPAILLYSDLFLAKPTGIEGLKFSEDEAEALSQVTSNLLNAFPEYFNNSDPKVAAIVGAVMVAGPIGYTKYKIYKSATSEKKVDKIMTKVQQKVEVDPNQQNFSDGVFTI